MRYKLLTSIGNLGMAVWLSVVVVSGAQQGSIDKAGITSPEFEVASVKGAPFSGLGGIRLRHSPGRIDYRDVTLRELLATAYRLRLDQIRGPSWIDTQYYVISATLSPDVDASMIPEMLKRLLLDRFDLRLHTERVSRSVYLLTSLTRHSLRVSPGDAPRGGVRDLAGKLIVTNSTMEPLCAYLSVRLGRPVIDHTGLKDRYDFELEYSLSDLTPQADGSGPLPDTRPSIGKALQDLGLLLKREKASVEVLMIDSARRIPSAQ